MMTLTGLHILLTYQCTYECDHCFVWGSPRQSGVFTLQHLDDALQQAVDVGTVNSVYFEGGETFIYYPILVKGVARARELGFSVGIVSNGYWATGIDEAVAWLRPLVDAGLDHLEISSDIYHGDDQKASSKHPGLAAAKQIGLKAGMISLEPPGQMRDPSQTAAGTPLSGGDIMYRGRAALKLTNGLPRQPWNRLDVCPYEDLSSPERIHLDPFGNLHICQGIVIGNVWETPLSEIIALFDPADHPIVGPLLAGGPAQLARHHGLDHEASYVDACHFCYLAREELRLRFPQWLLPDQMYGEPA